MPLSFLLLLGTILLCPTPGKTAVYYVTPTESPDDCPGQPCHTLDYYFCIHREKYFNNSERNATLILLQGKHNYTSCNLHSSKSIKDMEVFEMLGRGSAEDVVVYLSTDLELTNAKLSHFRNLTFTNADAIGYPSVTLSVYDDDYDQEPTTLEESKPLNTSVTVVVSGMIFNNVLLNQSIYGLTNLSVIVTNSIFMNRSRYWSIAEMTEYHVSYSRLLEVKQCTFDNSDLSIHNIRADVHISDCTLGTSNVNIVQYYSNIKISGSITFADSTSTPITVYYSGVDLSGHISFVNNTGTNGGAMALYSSNLVIDSNTTINFTNNKATDTGGAIYVAEKKVDDQAYKYIPCFYRLMNYDNESNWYDIRFENNTATNGGNDIYGTSMNSCQCYVVYKRPVLPSYCVHKQFFSYHPNSISSISSDPIRVCLCNNSQPQCDTLELQNFEVHPGEPFSLSAVIVGADLGTTLGAIYAVLEDHSSSVVLEPSTHVILNITAVCMELNYTIYSEEKYQALYLTVKPQSFKTVKRSIKLAQEHVPSCKPGHGCGSDYISYSLLHTPLLVNITLLPCPRGFTLLGDPPSCRCYPVLKDMNVDCLFIDNVGYQTWNSSKWIDIDADLKVYVAQYCPFGHCITDKRRINFQDNSSTQCSSGRKGRLCGSCKETLSLAIGSSHCIRCPNNNNVALFIFFAAAGLLLVLFISALNLTVTQGTINGVTFYANIFWSYQNILLPQGDKNNFYRLLRCIMAWLNLDFGIQTCFFKGLNAFWKTWLQYLFPLYIWTIAGLIIVGARYSSKLTKLFGNRAVSVLATLFLLSYTKLLKVIIDSLGFTLINIFDKNTSHTLTVWSLDGNYTYGHFPHILLVITALSVFLFMCLPFTFGLFLMPWLRRISGFKLLKWIPRLNPVFDAYFAPLKDKHHYWFGLLLILRGVLLLILTTTYAIYPEINCFILLMTSALLLCYANYHRVYKNRAVQLTENLYLILLVFVGGSGILEDNARHMVAYVSITIGLLTLAGIIIIRNVYRFCFKKREIEMEHVASEGTPNVHLLPGISYNSQFRDSILNEIEPLINNMH